MSQRIIDRFEEHARDNHLPSGSQAYYGARRHFITKAVNDGFLYHFGDDMSDLEAWQDLCYTIGVDGEDDDLRSIYACRWALQGVFVNIVDLVDAAEAGEEICAVFDTPEELRDYTRISDKVYPLSEAKSNAFLRRFLIRVF
ncbi:hypothetical protein HDZ31DRAFT_63672 [Schizophyllum fasciatum]